MKKFSVLLSALLLAAVPAAADTLTIDLDTATLEELTAVQEQISARVSDLRAAELADVDSIELSGTGTTIKTGVALPFAPARLTLTGTDDVSLTLTGGMYDLSYDASPTAVAAITDAATYDALVETSGDWTLNMDPIRQGGTITVSGTGSYVGDFFPLPTASIVSVQADTSNYDGFLSNFIVSLNHQYENLDSWAGEPLTNELLSKGDAFSADLIVKPTEGRRDYFWTVKCDPDISWSITLKE